MLWLHRCSEIIVSLYNNSWSNTAHVCILYYHTQVSFCHLQINYFHYFRPETLITGEDIHRHHRNGGVGVGWGWSESAVLVGGPVCGECECAAGQTRVSSTGAGVSPSDVLDVEIFRTEDLLAPEGERASGSNTVVPLSSSAEVSSSQHCYGTSRVPSVVTRFLNVWVSRLCVSPTWKRINNWSFEILAVFRQKRPIWSAEVMLNTKSQSKTGCEPNKANEV